jgi:hypothetical protein
MQPNYQILKSVLSLGLNYMRWTQLTPMLITWGVALAMLAALTLINFQEQVFSALEILLRWLTQLPVVGGYVNEMMSDQSGEIHKTTGDFKSFLLKAWSILSLAFMLASMAISAVFGPFQPWTLKRKLLFTSLGVGLLLAGLVSNYYANAQAFNGKASGWMLNFSLMSLAVFLVSTYCLSVSHFLRFLDDALLRNDAAERTVGHHTLN